jgi:hypothetical protein
MSPGNAEVLEKINKLPLLCRLGWHRWQVKEKIIGMYHNFGTERCTRCPAERTFSEEIY